MTPKKHNYKLTTQDKKDILTEYVLDRSKNNTRAICSKYDITERAFYDIVNKVSEEEKEKILNNSIIEYQHNFSKKTAIIIDRLLDRINKELDNTDKIQLSQLTTSFGILYDKMRLNENLSTSNSSININIKIE
jgi:nucleoid DNA-binding protein